MLSPEQRQQLLQAIEKKIKFTKAAITDYKDMTQPVAPDVAIGRLSRMDAINNKSVMEAALREAEAKLVRLQSSLNMIDDEKLGLCANCNEAIEFKRLLAMPDSLRCVRCSK